MHALVKVGGDPFTVRSECSRCLKGFLCLLSLVKPDMLILKIGPPLTEKDWLLVQLLFSLGFFFYFLGMLNQRYWECLSVIWPGSACFMVGVCKLMLDSDILDIFWWSVMLFMDQSQFSCSHKAGSMVKMQACRKCDF